MAPRAWPPTAVRPSEGMPGPSFAPRAPPRARGPGGPRPARARGSPEVAGAPAARRQRKSSRFPFGTRCFFWALAVAPAEGQGPGPEPGARRTGWVHGAGALCVGFIPAWRGGAGPSGVCGLRRLPAPGTAEREDSGSLCPRCPPATSRLQTPLRTRLEGQREKKGKIKREKGGGQ